MNAYDSVHVTAPHARMSKEEWQGVYRQAWDAYYTPEHVETVIRRAAEWGFDPNKMKWMMLSFHAAATIEGIHPLDSGIFRRKYRRERRPGLRARESARLLRALRGRDRVETLAPSAHVSDVSAARYRRALRPPETAAARRGDRVARDFRAERPRPLHRHGRRPLRGREGARTGVASRRHGRPPGEVVAGSRECRELADETSS
jgi:hypothetical protein